MTTTPKSNNNQTTPVEKVKWGETPANHLGYGSESERIKNRGLEDWEMVEKMSETSDHKIPYWFIAIFFVLLLVAIGLTFPFWGVRPGFERDWFDWGIVAGAAWVIIMGAVIYFMVDYRHILIQKKTQRKETK